MKKEKLWYISHSCGGDARRVTVRRLECNLLRLYARPHEDARRGAHFGLDAADHDRLDVIWPVLLMLGLVLASLFSFPPSATRQTLSSYLFSTFTFTVSFGRIRWPHVPAVQP